MKRLREAKDLLRADDADKKVTIHDANRKTFILEERFGSRVFAQSSNKCRLDSLTKWSFVLCSAYKNPND